MKKQLLLAAICTFGWMAIGTPQAGADEIASDDFSSNSLTGGTGSWATDWATSTGGAGASISLDTMALDLEAVVSNAGPNTNRRGAVHRQVTTDATLVRTITFDFTIDDFADANPSVANDRFNISGNGSDVSNAGSGSSWVAYGGLDMTSLQAGLGANWVFHDGMGNGGFNNMEAGENALVDSGIALVDDRTYNFTVVDDPGNLSYVITVADPTAVTTFTSGPLGYRGATFADPFLTFSARVFDAGDPAGFTVDNVSVSVVPEPGSLVVLFGAAGLTLLVRRRRNR